MAEAPIRWAEFAATFLETESKDLFVTLETRFPTITREEVFIGLVFAKAMIAADLVTADAEVQALESRVCALQRQLQKRDAA